MPSIDLRLHPDMLTIHVSGHHDELVEFINWVDDCSVELWEPNQIDTNGEYARFNVDKWHDQIERQKDRLTNSIWCIGPIVSAVALKLRWNEYLDAK
jgi:hypothetical protein